MILRTRAVLDLWPGGIGPGSAHVPVSRTITERSTVAYWPDRIVTGITRPTLTAFVPDRPNGTAVIVAPGGGFSRIVLDKEAAEMAHWLAPYGVTVLLLEYRLPGEGHAGGRDVPLQDAQRAIRVVRGHAADWRLDPNRIGFLGASAGGYMGASLATRRGCPVYQPVDAADRLSARPDFEILLYPVISMEAPLAHRESRTNLLGNDPSAALCAAYSPDRHVTGDVPPTFITVAADDREVLPGNAIGYGNALQAAGVRTALHVFAEGGHGFGIRDTRQLPVSTWPALAAAWLSEGGFVGAAPSGPAAPGLAASAATDAEG